MATVEFKPRPLQVLLNITKRCNLRCIHCFAASGGPKKSELTIKEIFALVNEISQLRVPLLTISGGEPCCHPDLCKVIEKATLQGVAVSLLTNGMLITGAIAHRLASAGLFGVGVSIEGKPATHNYIRQMAGSFQKAVRAIELFKSYGLAVGITMTVNKLNYKDIPFVINLSNRLDTRLTLQQIVIVGRAIDNQRLLELPKDFRDELEIDISPYLQPEPIAGPNVSPLNKCDAGRTKCIIDSTGEVLPCSYVDISSGNIRNSGLEKIWLYSDTLRFFRDSGRLEEPCRSCAVFEQCGGGCRARAWLQYGRLSAPDPACFPCIDAVQGDKPLWKRPSGANFSLSL